MKGSSCQYVAQGCGAWRLADEPATSKHPGRGGRASAAFLISVGRHMRKAANGGLVHVDSGL